MVYPEGIIFCLNYMLTTLIFDQGCTVFDFLDTFFLGGFLPPHIDQVVQQFVLDEYFSNDFKQW